MKIFAFFTGHDYFTYIYSMSRRFFFLQQSNMMPFLKFGKTLCYSKNYCDRVHNLVLFTVQIYSKLIKFLQCNFVFPPCKQATAYSLLCFYF